jgi:D-lactate dehydrogenase
MKVFVYSAGPHDQPLLQKAAAGKHELLFSSKRLSIDTAHLAEGCQAVSIFTADDASAAVLGALYTYGVRFISLRSVGYDHVDITKANRLGMQVANVPEYSPYAVAEHGVAMLMAVNRKIVESQLLQQMQDFRLDTLKGFDVHCKTVGIIGTGKIGMAFAKIMNGFGTTLLAHDPQPNEEALALGINYVSLETLFRESDILSIHCPLTPHTRHLVANPKFEWLKKGCILINTSRGAIIHTADLIAALESGRVGAACLDVYEHEKGLFFEDHRNHILHDTQFARLKSFRNVLITGHQGFLTAEALRGIAETTVINLDHWQKHEASPHELYSKKEEGLVDLKKG